MEKLPSSRLQASWRPNFRSDSQAGARRSRSPVRLARVQPLKLKNIKRANAGDGVVLLFSLDQPLPGRPYLCARRNGRRKASSKGWLVGLPWVCQSSSVGDKESLSR